MSFTILTPPSWLHVCLFFFSITLVHVVPHITNTEEYSQHNQSNKPCTKTKVAIIKPLNLEN